MFDDLWKQELIGSAASIDIRHIALCPMTSYMAALHCGAYKTKVRYYISPKYAAAAIKQMTVNC